MHRFLKFARALVFALVIAGAPARGVAQPIASGPADEAARLTVGLHAVIGPGSPGTLVVFGPNAAPLIVGKGERKSSAVVAALASLDQGRIVAWGHTGYLANEAAADPDTGKLLERCLRWAAARGPTDKKIRVAFSECDFSSTMNTWESFESAALSGVDWTDKLANYDVLVCSPSHWKPAQADAVERFIRAGGGLIAAQTGWGWLQLNPGQSLADHVANHLLQKAGLAWSDGFAGHTTKSGFEIHSIPEFCHAGKALDAIIAASDGKSKLSAADLAQATQSAIAAVRALPADDQLLRPRLAALQKEHGQELVPTQKKPLDAKHPLERLLLTLRLEDARNLPPDRVAADPAANEFPGAVPADAKAEATELTIDARVPGWHSTGLYAPPGKVVTAAAAAPLPKARIEFQIGAHTDRLWDKESWSRVPEITRRTGFMKDLATLVSPFGGLIYVDIPERCPADSLTFKITGGVPAPLFEAGKTDLAEWREQIRKRPGPWAELASSKVIVTVPSDAIRTLDDPATVMEVWDKILDAAATLAARPLKRERPERYVADVQISAGYMHSGYPIMTHLDAAAAMVSREQLLAGQWGLYHELGHNHQSGDWTFDGTGEVTNNVFTVYILEHVCGVQGRNGHEALAKLDDLTRKYLAGGAKFEAWKSDPFLALTMYVQLREAFGWEPYEKVFAEYRDLSAGERPKNDDEKRDQWLTRMSRATGHNLGPFFEAWGVPTSAAARAAVAKLPEWMPAGFPPK